MNDLFPGLPSGFPVPDPAAAAHGRLVRQRILDAIDEHGGWLDFARYMELALYAPGLGYYSAGSAKLGAAGDFVTAPESSTLFGRCVARSLLPVLEEMPDAEILELGAGSGALAEAVLGELAAYGALPPRYCIVEPSADLAERQRARLDRLPAELRQVLRWESALPNGRPRGVILANEVIDALPVRRFHWQAGGARPLGVVSEDGRFVWKTGPRDALLDAVLGTDLGAVSAAWPAGYESEICTVLPDWIRQVLAAYRQGAALFVDYGMPRAEYYHPQRSGGTLRCHYRHRAHSDPLILAGLQDITAWVDFTAVAQAAVAVGWDVTGFVTQAHFLLDAGLMELLADTPADGSIASLAVAQQIKTLTLPGEMGERFRVLALGSGLQSSPRGFDFRDLRDRL